MPFVIRNDQRVAYQHVLAQEFRDEVIAHAKRKATFTPALSDDDYTKTAIFVFDRVHAYLRNHPSATYDSYVRMMLVYFIRGTDQVEQSSLRETLANEHFGINTRVQVAYDLSRLFLQAGF